MPSRLQLTRERILAFRRRAGCLDERLPGGRRALRRAAWAGLQDSMPRAALLSINARVAGTRPDAWEEPSLVQVWGPRFSAFVVAERDRAVFTLGRLSDDPAGLARATETADRLEKMLAGRRTLYGPAGRALGLAPNALRYAAPTGRVVMRWDGAGQPTIWMVPAPDVDPAAAQQELARRYLQIYGPATAASFAQWAGLRPRRGSKAFAALESSLTPVRTPVGDAWILSRDEAAVRSEPDAPAPARLLPSGDAYYLQWGADRDLLVPDPVNRDRLWTSRVWPGAVLVAGEIVGTWRRSQEEVTIEAWRRLSRRARDAVEQEAMALPLPDVPREISVRWDG